MTIRLPGIASDRGTTIHMANLAEDLTGQSINPLDVVEELVTASNWSCNRHSDSELMIEVAGRWCGYHLYFLWRPEVGAMFFSCQVDLRVPATKRADCCDLLATVNEDLWLGHFDIVKEDGTPMFRHTIPLRGAPGLSAEQFEDLIDTALAECERFYPALQLVVWGGRSVTEALQVARMDTIGEA